MSTFVQWYISSLKSHPMLSNIASALVLMTAGDVMAQGIEIRQIAAAEEAAAAENKTTLLLEPPKSSASDGHVKRQVHFRRYGTMTPDVEGIQHKLHEKHLKEAKTEEHELALLITNWQKSIESICSDFQDEVASLDFFRTGTMGVWAVAAYTPYYVGLYRLYDRFLPVAATPATVMVRVGLSFVASIPLNAAFFCYGSFVHHLTEWSEQLKEWQINMNESSQQKLENYYSLMIEEVPFGFEVAWQESRSKLESELVNTIKASGAVWIPINMFNFSVMPPHLRPLTLMFCSAFWNCYLSLAQHRDASIEVEE